MQLYLSPLAPLGYVRILKNASSSIVEGFCDENNWRCTFYRPKYLNNLRLSDRTFITVLRDPIERWRSGIAQIFYRYATEGYQPEDCTFTNFSEFWNLVLERISLDDHTVPQVDYINKLQKWDVRSFAFFTVNKNLNAQIIEWLSGPHGYGIKYNYATLKTAQFNKSTAHPKRLDILTDIDRRTTPALLKRLKEYYKEDIALYELFKN